MKKIVLIALMSGTIFQGAHALFIDVQNNSSIKVELSYEDPQGVRQSKTFDMKYTGGSINLPYCPSKITATGLTGKYKDKELASLTPINCKRFILLIQKGEKTIEVTQKE